MSTVGSQSAVWACLEFRAASRCSSSRKPHLQLQGLQFVLLFEDDKMRFWFELFFEDDKKRFWFGLFFEDDKIRLISLLWFPKF